MQNRRWIVLALISTLLLPLLLFFFQYSSDVTSDSAIIVLKDARFMKTDHAMPPSENDSGWVKRQLPDNWTVSMPDQGGKGWYQLGFEMSEVDHKRLWGVYLPNVNMTGDVYINGKLIGSGGKLAEPLARNWFRPLLFEFPNEMLKSGLNTIHICIAAYPNEGGGVGKVMVGPADSLKPLYEQLWSIKIATAMVMFVMMVVFMLMLIALGIMRPQDKKYLWLGGASFFSAMMCLNFFLRDIPISRHLWEALIQISVGMFVYCLMMFVNRFLDLRLPRFEAVCTVYFPLLGLMLIAVPEVYQIQTYQYWQLGTLALAVLLFVLSARQWWRCRQDDALVIAIGLGIAAVLGAHDLSVAELNLEYEQLYLFQFAPIAFLLLAAGLWILRLVKALNDYESLNRNLNRLVAEKSSALEEALAEVQLASDAKSRFFAAASHDLRQPLHSIVLLLAGLEEQLKNSRNIYLVGKIREGIDHLRLMFDHLLDKSRIEAGAVEIDPVDFRIGPFIETLRLEYAPQFLDRGIDLRVHPLDVWLNTDPALLERILRNYIENALRYTQSGSVLIGCRRRMNCLRIEVWDSGPGIPNEDQQSIFEEFRQLDSPSHNQGSGLGLSIVRQIAELLKLTISVRSKLGVGSVFAVDVPFGSLMPEQASIEDSGFLIATEKHLLERRIWVVDDDVRVLEAVEVLLESWGCLCRTFSSTEQLTSFMQQERERPELIISDFWLEEVEITGMEIIQTIRSEAEKEIAAILITGDTTVECADKSVSLLYKPVDTLKLYELMQRLFVRF